MISPRTQRCEIASTTNNEASTIATRHVIPDTTPSEPQGIEHEIAKSINDTTTELVGMSAAGNRSLKSESVADHALT